MDCGCGAWEGRGIGSEEWLRARDLFLLLFSCDVAESERFFGIPISFLFFLSLWKSFSIFYFLFRTLIMGYFLLLRGGKIGLIGLLRLSFSEPRYIGVCSFSSLTVSPKKMKLGSQDLLDCRTGWLGSIGRVAYCDFWDGVTVSYLIYFSLRSLGYLDHRTE